MPVARQGSEQRLTPYINYRGVVILRTRMPRRNPFVEAYCLKCRVKREMSNPTAITMKNGKPATEGKCPTCGTKMFKIGKA